MPFGEALKKSLSGSRDLLKDCDWFTGPPLFCMIGGPRVLITGVSSGEATLADCVCEAICMWLHHVELLPVHTLYVYYMQS